MATQQLTIPMFPLDVVILPGETKTLHIFEERYKQLISDCLENEANFGVPFINHKSLGDFGVEVKINHVIKTYDNGEMDILIEGVAVFKLIEFSYVLTPKLYGAGVIVYETPFNTAPSNFLQELTKEYMALLQNSLAIDAFDHATVYSIARLIDLSSQEKYELLKAGSLQAKEDVLKSKIKLFTHLIKVEGDLKTKFILN